MNEEQLQSEDTIVTLEGEDGHSYSCQIIDIFDFDEKEYALLLNLGGEDGEEEGEGADEKGSLVIMRLIQKGDQAIFQTIETEEEFQKVVAHVESMAKTIEGGDEHGCGEGCSDH
ncbi:MAG: DUF1292 domain-containing protein [Candidatus Obscuribacterales bacterium]|nr:DUF1292 domain-containing protein [Candidatus Obscuribacterales bacterium]